MPDSLDNLESQGDLYAFISKGEQNLIRYILSLREPSEKAKQHPSFSEKDLPPPPTEAEKRFLKIVAHLLVYPATPDADGKSSSFRMKGLKHTLRERVVFASGAPEPDAVDGCAIHPDILIATALVARERMFDPKREQPSHVAAKEVYTLLEDIVGCSIANQPTADAQEEKYDEYRAAQNSLVGKLALPDRIADVIDAQEDGAQSLIVEPLKVDFEDMIPTYTALLAQEMQARVKKVTTPPR